MISLPQNQKATDILSLTFSFNRLDILDIDWTWNMFSCKLCSLFVLFQISRKEYFGMGIFVAVFLLFCLICVIVLLKVRFKPNFESYSNFFKIIFMAWSTLCEVWPYFASSWTSKIANDIWDREVFTSPLSSSCCFIRETLCIIHSVTQLSESSHV